jgi:hypothetical protein
MIWSVISLQSSRLNTSRSENDRPASSEGQGNYMKQVRFTWPLIEAVLLILKFRLSFFKDDFLEEV